MKALSLFIIVPGMALGQSDEDALRYSMQMTGGTARYMGLGGAFGALGADIGSLSSNPAGIGLYRTSDFQFTMAVNDVTTKASYLGNTLSGSKAPFNIPSFGMVVSSDVTRKHSESKWKRVNFAFGMNRMNDYNKVTNFAGYNTENSLSDYYAEQANQNGGVNPGQISNTYPFGAGLLYETYVIDPIPYDTTMYRSRIQNGNIQQSSFLEEHGSHSEYVLSLGANYDDHLLIGATMGLPAFYYYSDWTFIENDEEDAHEDFVSYSLYNHVGTHAFGINGKFGLAYILNDFLRVGVAFHTPTLFAMHDEYNSYASSVIGPAENYDWGSPFGSYDYDLVTPWRLVGSVAGFFGKSGFISADYELVDYAAMKFNFNRYATSDELIIENQLNQTIDQKYRAASSVRVGGEYAYDMFRIRAGIGYYDSPFKKGVATGDSDFSRWTYSGGLGMRGDHYYFDLAYVRTEANELFQPYTLSNEEVPGAAVKKVSNNFVATVGARF